MKKEENANNIHRIQEEYLYNNIFIIQLQQSCYGSVKDQISFLEEKLAYYLNTKDTNEKMNAMDAIITENRATKNLKFQNFLSIGGVLLTIIFGLPAIYETATILKKCLFPRIDIPIITIENSSIVIWVLLVIYVLIKVLVNRFSNKN